MSRSFPTKRLFLAGRSGCAGHTLLPQLDLFAISYYIQAYFIDMSLSELDLPPSRPDHVGLPNEHMSLRWKHRSAKIHLLWHSLHSEAGQTFWSYTIYIAPQSIIDLDEIVFEVKAQVQSLSDRSIIPPSWEIAAKNVVVLDTSTSTDVSWNASLVLQRLFLLLSSCVLTC